ncbi:N-terminal double-transmembrane domain-containing protein [Duganella sp. CF517]|uniref:hypothetical protein n=1 Tax=Duganella sp. CF517 TaxID=1881038 RepID=UPI0008AE5F07|nr:hypothetical protein [Duganella sp. CF517]SEO46489.1 N-terminal double-transmembrane domain-containing protein [Duganella sp. CF517]
MLSSYPFWWFALPVLLLPIWWHRQKRQRLKAQPLATARFLPVAAPEQLRVWQWRDRVLLLVRCLLLLALIAWLAATIVPWRGNTVLLDAGADKAWAEREIGSAGFADAPRVDLPPDALQWLRRHERDWRPDARLLVVARAGQIAMPARMPRFDHQVEVRTMPAAGQAAEPAVARHPVVLSAASGADAAWRSLFAAFDKAGDAGNRYPIGAAPDAATELLVWDMPGEAPPAGWRAPHWWIATASAKITAFPELKNAAAVTINGLALQYADGPRGRLWTSQAFPPRDADTARALYETWRSLGAAPAPAYPMPSRAMMTKRSAFSATIDAKPAAWLAYVLLALFLLERILAHARRN